MNKWLHHASVAFLLACAGCGESGRSIVVHGDSTAIASRIPMTEKVWNVAPWLDGQRWWVLLGRSYSPARPILNDAVKGQAIAQMREKMINDAEQRSSTTIIYDRVNREEDAADYIAALSDAIGTLRTKRFLIMPQVPNAGGERDRHAEAVMPSIDREVLRRWPANTFSLAERRAFLTELSNPDTRADGLHRNGMGERIEFEHIKRWIDARGW